MVVPPNDAAVMSFNPLYYTERSALRVVKEMWAGSTWESRVNLWRRFLDFCKANRLDPEVEMDYCSMLFVESTRANTEPSTRLRYSKDLAAIATRLGLASPISRMYQAGLRGMGAQIPQRQAPAVTIEQVRVLAPLALQERMGARLQALLFVMWKSASRYDEVSRLMGRQLLQTTDTRIVIYWGDRTKSTRQTPFRPDSWVVIDHPTGIPPPILRTLRALEQDEELHPHTTEHFDKWLHRALPNSGITAHSFKAGAVSCLIDAVSREELDLAIIPILAKHKVDFTLPTATLRYQRDQVALALVIGTQRATTLLPW